MCVRIALCCKVTVISAPLVALGWGAVLFEDVSHLL